MASKTDIEKDNDFLVVDRLDQISDKQELEAKIFSLKEEILYLKSWKNNCEKFQEKFFELFIAFTVLVTPLAIAFVFNYLFSNGNEFNINKDINCASCPPEWKISRFENSEESNENQRDLLCCLLPPQSPSSTLHIRDAVVPVLIAISCIVGLPYYYHMLEELSHNMKEYPENDNESEDGDDDDAEDAAELVDTVKDDGDEKKKKKMNQKVDVEEKKMSKNKDESKGVNVNQLSIK